MKTIGLGLIAFMFLSLIAAALGGYVFSCVAGWPFFLIKGCVLVIISIAFFCLLYSLFMFIKEIELAELKKAEKEMDFKHKKAWEEFSFDLKEKEKSKAALQKENDELKKAKGEVEKELKELKESNKEVLLALDEQTKEMYIATLSRKEKPNAEESEKRLDEMEKTLEKMKKHLIKKGGEYE